MKKQIRELESILHGCVGFVSHEKGDIASRFTPEQMEFYTKRNVYDFRRARAMAGIYLDFVTDAEVISFDYSFVGAYVMTSGFDVWENGVFGENYPVENADGVHVEYRIKAQGNAHIMLYFPTGVAIATRDFELGNFVPAENSLSGLTLFYGDSITQAAYTAHPSLTWTKFVSDGLGTEFVNRGIGSFIFDVNSLPAEPDCKPDYLFIEYGLNDFAKVTDFGVAAESIDKYMKRIGELYPGAKTFVITPEFGRGGVQEPEMFEKRTRYAREVERVAKKYGYTVLLGDTLVPALPSMFVADFVHLSDAGNPIYAHSVLNAVTKAK